VLVPNPNHKLARIVNEKQARERHEQKKHLSDASIQNNIFRSFENLTFFKPRKPAYKSD